MQRTLSGGNIDSISLKPGKSSLSDLIFEDDNVQRPQKSTNAATPSFLDFSDAISAPNQDVFNSTAGQKHHVTIMDQSLDLFANMPAETPSADKVIPVALSMDNAWWATFDTPPEQKQPSASGLSYVAATSNDREVLSRDLFSFESNDEPTWFQSSKDNPSVTNLSTATSLDPGSSQVSNLFISHQSRSLLFLCMLLISTIVDSQKKKERKGVHNKLNLNCASSKTTCHFGMFEIIIFL